MLSRQTTMLPLEVKIFDKLALEAPSQKLSKTVLAIVMKSLLQQGGWLVGWLVVPNINVGTVRERHEKLTDANGGESPKLFISLSLSLSLGVREREKER